jgi:SapC
MITQALLYKTAVPVSRARHGDCCVEAGADYGFSSEVNSVPLTAVEFSHAAPEYPIVFAGPKGEMTPAAILGVRDNENLFLTEDLAWGGAYIPAFVRRYPFVFTRSDDRFLLCIDEQFTGFNRAGRGEPLFAPDGETSAYTNGVLKFMQEFQVQFERTRAFCARLAELDLLDPMQAQITEGSGERLSLGGFMAVNRNRLSALPGDVLSELIKAGHLELIFLHLQSMRNFVGLRERLETARTGAEMAAAQAPPEAAAPASVH